MRILGINALYHDPSAALVVDGSTVAAAEEERFSRRKHGKRPVPFSAWELPELSAAWCLEQRGLRPDELDVVTYSFDPSLRLPPNELGLFDPWDDLRQDYAERAPDFLATALPGLDPARVRFVPHHVAHAASAGLAAPFDGNCAVLVLDGRGERHSHLAGRVRRRQLEILYSQQLPHSLGLLYEDATDHLGFLRSSDEYKVMALASYGKPRHLDYLRQFVHADGRWRLPDRPGSTGLPWPRRGPPTSRGPAEHADLAAVCRRCSRRCWLTWPSWLHEQTGVPRPGPGRRRGAQLRGQHPVFSRDGPFEDVWVQPAAGDAGTALGGALFAAPADGRADHRRSRAPTSAGLDRRRVRRRWLRHRRCRTTARPTSPTPSPTSSPMTASSPGSRAAANSGRGRSATARCWPTPAGRRTCERLNDVKGREQFRPVAPMVLARARRRSSPRGPIPSRRTCCSCTTSQPDWRERIPAVGPRRRNRPHPVRRPGDRAAGGPDAGSASSGAPGCRW